MQRRLMKQERRASEDPEEKQLRLQQMARRDQERRTSEAPEDRDLRLQQMGSGETEREGPVKVLKRERPRSNK